MWEEIQRDFPIFPFSRFLRYLPFGPAGGWEGEILESKPSVRANGS